MAFDNDVAQRVQAFQNSMSYHRPNEETQAVMENIRESIADVGEDFIMNVQNCRELSLALTKLEEASMWMIKALALYGTTA